MPSYEYLELLTGVLLLALSYLLYHNRTNRCRLPGPKPKFLIENLTDLPSHGHEWLEYAALGRKYGTSALDSSLTSRIIVYREVVICS